MSHITLAQRGLAALETRNWDEAITNLSTALQSSENPAWLIGRSKALAKLKRPQEALDDANLAWHRAHDRSARPLMAEAHYRRAVAHYSLGQHANADACCIYAMRMIKGHPAVEKENPALEFVGEDGLWTATAADAIAEAQSDVLNSRDRPADDLSVMRSEPQTQLWRLASTTRIQVLNTLQQLPEDDAGRKLTIGARPELKELADVGSPNGNETGEVKNIAQLATRKPLMPVDTPLRIQDYQSQSTMSVSIFSKGVDKDQLVVEFQPSRVRLDPLIFPNGDEKEFKLDLWGEIDPSSSKFTVTPNKVELSLAKKVIGKWPTLKADDVLTAALFTKTGEDLTPSSAAKPSGSDSETENHPQDLSAFTAAATAPSYPTSSLSGPKNWDQVGADEGSDDEKDVNHFFKLLYKNATPEQQRAMMKSFTESNGTSLSTDWNDVKNRKVETVPPEGVEAKKWE